MIIYEHPEPFMDIQEHLKLIRIKSIRQTSKIFNMFQVNGETTYKGLRPARLTRGQKKKDRYDMLNMMGTQLSKILNFIANIHSSIKTLLSFCSQILFLGRF